MRAQKSGAVQEGGAGRPAWFTARWLGNR